MSIGISSGSFFDRLRNIATNVDQLLEGGFWCTWCSLNVYACTQDRKEKQNIENLPESIDKTNKLWLAKKNYILSTFSMISGISMVTSWASEVGLVALGLLNPALGCMGFAGSSITSFSKFWDSLYELQEEALKCKSLKLVKAVFAVAFYVNLTAWGAFGALHVLFGGGALFQAMDSFLLCALIFGTPYLTLAVAFSIIPPPSGNPALKGQVFSKKDELGGVRSPPIRHTHSQALRPGFTEKKQCLPANGS